MVLFGHVGEGFFEAGLLGDWGVEWFGAHGGEDFFGVGGDGVFADVRGEGETMLILPLPIIHPLLTPLLIYLIVPLAGVLVGELDLGLSRGATD